jgi:hypothetical protein
MSFLRPLIGFCLGLMLALTSVTMAQARHYGPMGTSVVICANGMAQTITLDANGQKLPFTHVCPDCIMAALDMPVAQSLPQRPNFGKVVALPLPVAAMVQVPMFHAAARGPPVLM